MDFWRGAAVGAASAAALAWVVAVWRRRRAARFFSFAAHEINTPITAINMTVLNLLSGVFGEISKDQVQWMELMREQVVRLSGMVGELRDLIHIDMHRDMSTHRVELPLGEAVESALRAVRHGCAHAGIGLAVDVPKDLPTVSSDPDRLTRTITSLLFHAKKFRLEGGISVLARNGSKQYVEVLVEYRGPRLAPREARRSLALYFPASQRRDQVQGSTGLGLGVPRAVIRRLGGELRFEVAGDGQSRLTLLVPRAG